MANSIQNIANSGVFQQMSKLTSAQENMISQAPAEQQGMLRAQFEMEQQGQLVQFITGILKKMDEMNSAIARNIA
jgi:hypothetical protein